MAMARERETRRARSVWASSQSTRRVTRRTLRPTISAARVGAALAMDLLFFGHLVIELVVERGQRSLQRRHWSRLLRFRRSVATTAATMAATTVAAVAAVAAAGVDAEDEPDVDVPEGRHRVI